MRKLFLVGAFLVASFPLNAQMVQVYAPSPSATVIDFNGYSPYTIFTNQFAALGVTTTSCMWSEDGYNYLFGNDVMHAANFNNRGQNCLGQNLYAPITFEFSVPMTYFGFEGISNGYIFLATAHGTISQYAPVDNATFVGFTDDAGFTSVTAYASHSGAFAFDNLSFDNEGLAVTTPEPATTVLVLTGLTGIVAARRRRQTPRA
jgi:hypothetical protein